MVDDLPPNANGAYVRWVALAESERRQRTEWRDDIREVSERRDRQLLSMTERLAGMERRTDALESIRDEQRGAWRLVIFLIGGNLLATVALVLSIVAPR